MSSHYQTSIYRNYKIIFIKERFKFWFPEISFPDKNILKFFLIFYAETFQISSKKQPFCSFCFFGRCDVIIIQFHENFCGNNYRVSKQRKSCHHILSRLDVHSCMCYTDFAFKNNVRIFRFRYFVHFSSNYFLHVINSFRDVQFHGKQKKIS